MAHARLRACPHIHTHPGTRTHARTRAHTQILTFIAFPRQQYASYYTKFHANRVINMKITNRTIFTPLSKYSFILWIFTKLSPLNKFLFMTPILIEKIGMRNTEIGVKSYNANEEILDLTVTIFTKLTNV